MLTYQPIGRLVVLVLAPVAGAQEHYWTATRSGAVEVTTCGSVVQRVSLGSTVNQVRVAPDGKIWVTHASLAPSRLDILNPDGTTFRTITGGSQAWTDVAFDRLGHW